MNRAVRGWTTLTAGKVLNLLAAALALQGLGDVIPFQAGCRPLELSGLILKHLQLKKGDSKYTGPRMLCIRGPVYLTGKRITYCSCARCASSRRPAMSCSRKSGWAMEMMASARSQVDRPFRLIMPYSVTT